MSGYTEGEWGINQHKNIIFAKSLEDQIPIAVVSSGTIQGAYETSLIRANAHLIAAAPDMFEVLEECASTLAFLANHLEGRIGEGAQAEMFRLAEEAEDALKKARGEQ